MRWLFAVSLAVAVSACDSPQPSVATEAPTSKTDTPVASAAGLDTLSDIGRRKQGTDWPLFLGPEGDSKSTETGLVTPWPKAGLRVVWQKDVGTGYGIGSVAAGRYFQFDRHNTRPGVGSARLTCMNAETGEELWRFEYPTDYEDLYGYNNGPRCSPVIDGNRVYIYGAEGKLHCLQASDGRRIWSVDTAAKFNVIQNFFGVGSTPSIHGDLLICMVGGSPQDTPNLYAAEGNGTGIVAFDKYSGEVRYSVTDQLASYASPQLATIQNEPWCFMFCREGLVGLNPSSGKVHFEYPWRAEIFESVNASAPVVVGNEVFISETYQIGSSLLAVKPGGFDVVWKDERRSRERSFLAHWNTPVYVDGYLYGCSGRNPPDAELRCIDWKTGKVQWSTPRGEKPRSSLLYVDGHFVCLYENGVLELIKVNPQRYELVSTFVVAKARAAAGFSEQSVIPIPHDPYWAAPILAHGLMYVRGEDRVTCLELIAPRADK